MKLFHKIFMAFIVLFTLIAMVNGQTVLFNETFSNVEFYRQNLIGSSNCSVGDFNITNIANNGYNVSLDNEWQCWANQNSSNFVFTWQENDGFSSLYNTQNGIIMGHSVAVISTPYKHSAIVNRFDSTQNLNPNTTVDLYCRDADVGSEGAEDVFTYLVFGNDDEEKAIINLGNNFTTCSIPKPYNFGHTYDFDNHCCLLTNIVGSANDCQSNVLENPSFTVADAVSSCGSLSDSDFQNLDYVMIYQASEHDPAVAPTFYFDDLTLTESALPSNITNQTYVEDFEDTNFTEYTLDRFNPKTYIGSVENPIITANEDLSRFRTLNKLHRVTDTPDASTYAVMGNTTYTGGGFSGTRGGVKLFDVDLSSYGFILDSGFNISFDMKSAYQGYDNDDFTIYIFFETATNSTTIVLNKDTPQSGWCDLDRLVTKNVTTSWDTYAFSIQDMADNGCSDAVLRIGNQTLTDFEFFTVVGEPSVSTSNVQVYLDNLQLGGIGVMTNVTPSNATPNITDVIYFEELFGEDAFSYDETECTTQGDTTTQLQAYADPMDFGNHSWYCFMDTKSSNYISFDNISDTEKINTPQGLEIYSSTTINFGNRQRKLTTFFIGEEVDLGFNDTISFSCMIPDQSTQIDAYLYFGEWDNASALISLGKDNSTSDRCDVSGIPSAPCCELDDIVGESLDCNSDTKVNVELGIQEILDACPEFDSFTFLDMEEVGLWITEYDFAGYSYIYFDDYIMSAREGLVGNNTLPIIAQVNPDPDPANVSEIVTWTVYIWDDDQQEEIYTAFDCENDGSLDYGWQVNRTTVASKVWEFNCSYPSAGTYTGVAWASDIVHEPINTSASDQVQVTLMTAEEEGGSCEGFVAPPCSGDCAFFDDFSYAGYPVNCNGWSGLQKHPKNGKFVVQELNFTEYSVEVEYDDIHDYEYDSVFFSFDWIVNTDNRVILTMGQSLGGLNAVYLYWDGGSLLSLDSVSPYVTNLGGFTKGTEYSLTGIINFDTQTIEYTVFGSNTTVEFFDETTESIGDIDFDWIDILDTNFTIDDFLVSTGDVNANGTAPTVTVDYTYDGDFFCAINWTRDPPRFSRDNCEARGYSITGSLLGLCLPRACLSDSGSALFNWATDNILFTIVVGIAFILLAPLLVAIATRRR